MFSTNRVLFIVVLLTGFCGCNSSNKGELRDTVARLPDGGEIYIKQVKVFGANGSEVQSRGPRQGPQAVWTRPEKEAKTMLTLFSDSGSPGYDNAQVHISDDGNRVWLVQDSQVICSFDYNKGIAVLGQHCHPSWATVTDKSKNQPD